MTKEEFVARFKTRIQACAGATLEDGTNVAEYAGKVAPTYWDDPDQRAEGPEACAESDMSYWEAA